MDTESGIVHVGLRYIGGGGHVGVTVVHQGSTTAVVINLNLRKVCLRNNIRNKPKTPQKLALEITVHAHKGMIL